MATTGAEVSRRTSTRSPFGSVVRRTVAGSRAMERSETVMESLDDCETAIAQDHETRREARGAVPREPRENGPRDHGRSRYSSLESGWVDSPNRAQRNVAPTVTATSDIQSHRAAADSRNAIPEYATNISAITSSSGRESTGQISTP